MHAGGGPEEGSLLTEKTDQVPQYHRQLREKYRHSRFANKALHQLEFEVNRWALGPELPNSPHTNNSSKRRHK
jgi:hypothetical protein